jgi:hypothetical protein
VTFERRDGNIIASWTDGHVPQLVTYDEPDREALANFPQVPAQLTENSPELLQALHNAAETADDQSVRFALGSVQLQADGAINATDGRHVLAQYGFQFGWEGDVLKRLPGDDDFNQPVTIDVNGQVAIRAKSDTQTQLTELLLSNSQATGEALRFNTNRRFLGRAMKLGFREVLLYGTEQPAVCRDATRVFVWAVLGQEGALKPDDNFIRIESPADAGAANSHPTPRTRKPTNMAKNKSVENGAVPANTAPAETTNGQPRSSEAVVARSLIEQAVVVRNLDRIRSPVRLAYGRITLAEQTAAAGQPAQSTGARRGLRRGACGGWRSTLCASRSG